MNCFFSKSGVVLGVACLLSNFSLSAEEALPVYELGEYVVSSGPVPRTVADFASPFTSIDEDDVSRKNASTLGQLLDEQPGVTATSFGAGASRPIIRGFDGPRVRILDSGIEALDVSDTSPDHGTSVEPMLVERVEVLRGPSTLLYGSSAIGGVVNVIGRELPRALVDPKGYEGNFETRYDTVSRGFTSLGYGAVGGDLWAVSFTALDRESENYEIPGEAEIHSEEEHEEEEGSHGILENSFVDTESYSFGGTWFFGDSNFFGLSYASYGSNYGVPGHGHEDDDHHVAGEEHEEEGVAIDLDRKRYDAELVVSEPMAWIEALRFRMGYTDYEHVELEGDEIGTRFEREGWEFRGELAHIDIGIFDSGVVGFQASDTDFSAAGDEAFTPPSATRNQAVFISEHIHGEEIHWDMGFRAEDQEVSPDSGGRDYEDLATSIALSGIWNFADQHSLSIALQRSQRHPTSAELYANGPHLATEQFEIGDDSLGLETAHGVDVTYSYDSEEWKTTVSAFYTYFDDFIFAEETGVEMDDLPVFEYEAVEASFVGIEAELEYFVERSVERQLSYRVFADYVYATNEDAGESLPRIPPLRLGIGSRYVWGQWDAGILLRYNFEQNRTSSGESDTSSFTELNVDLSHRRELGNGLELTLFGRLDNLLDETIRSHTSFLKEVAPLPGRSLTVGARVAF
ncbi:MAG: TonB-dependent receptor [Opitutaceae bacterium]